MNISAYTLRAAGRRSYVPQPTGCVLFVGRLAPEATIARIAQHFGADRVVGIKRVFDDAGRPRAFGFITLTSVQDAEDACAELRGSMFEGRTLEIRIADEHRSAA